LGWSSRFRYDTNVLSMSGKMVKHV
jgi:hypothetical protein